MDLMRVGEQMAYPSLSGLAMPAKMPTLTERLTFRKKDLESQLEEVNKALDALNKNPEFQSLFDLVSQVRY